MLVCVAVGLAAGAVGLQVTGGATWFLAVPVLLAAGWFVFADPTACLPAQRRGPGGGQLSDSRHRRRR